MDQRRQTKSCPSNSVFAAADAHSVFTNAQLAMTNAAATLERGCHRPPTIVPMRRSSIFFAGDLWGGGGEASEI